MVDYRIFSSTSNAFAVSKASQSSSPVGKMCKDLGSYFNIQDSDNPFTSNGTKPGAGTITKTAIKGFGGTGQGFLG